MFKYDEQLQMFVLIEHILQIVFIESDGEHDEDAGEHPQDLEGQPQPVGLLLLAGGYWMGVARGQLRHHVHQRHVQEDARRGREHPGGEVVDGPEKQANNHPDEGQHGGEYIVEYCLFYRHSGLEQHGKVPNFVRQLVAKYGKTGREATHVSIGKCGSNGKTIRQVVDTVTEDDHPGYTGDVAGSRVGVGVGVAVAVV